MATPSSSASSSSAASTASPPSTGGPSLRVKRMALSGISMYTASASYTKSPRLLMGAYSRLSLASSRRRTVRSGRGHGSSTERTSLME
eukprot:scaffold121108_cov28-Tisochrysis_lutea.AAC.2